MFIIQGDQSGNAALKWLASISYKTSTTLLSAANYLLSQMGFFTFRINLKAASAPPPTGCFAHIIMSWRTPCVVGMFVFILRCDYCRFIFHTECSMRGMQIISNIIRLEDIQNADRTVVYRGQTHLLLQSVTRTFDIGVTSQLFWWILLARKCLYVKIE